MKNSHVMFSVAKVLKGVSKGLGIAEEIGQDDDECPLSDFFGDSVEGINQAGFTLRREPAENLKKVLKVCRTPAGRQFEVKSFIAA